MIQSRLRADAKALTGDLPRYGLTAAFALGLSTAALAEPIRGAGSTFAAPVIVEWSRDYEARRADGGDYASPDWHVDYELVGSLAGLMRLDQAEMDFAATDVPVAPPVLAARGRQQFPIVMGAVAVVANVPPLRAGELKLAGGVLADIYLGRVTRWDDARIKAENPSLALPALDIRPVHRQDGSGSTFTLTSYLKQESPNWRLGADTLVKWPGGLGAEGTSAMLDSVRTTPGAIGYAELGQATRAGLSSIALKNRAGAYVPPSAAGVTAAAAAANWEPGRDFHATLVNGPGDAAYPLATATFAVIPVEGRAPERVARVQDLFRTGFLHGAQQAQALGYVPLPPRLVETIEAYWGGLQTPAN